MFINNVSADGNKVDGFGSVFSFKLMSYALSQVYRIGYVDNKLKNIVGGEFLNLSQEDYDKKLNDYLNFEYTNSINSEKEPFDIFFGHPYKPPLSLYQSKIYNFKRNIFFSEFQRNIERINRKEILTSLARFVPSESNNEFYKDGLNIVIHLRAPLPDIDLFFESNRRYFYGSYKDTDRVNNIIRQLEHAENNVKLNFHIIGLGERKLFEEISPMYERNDLFIHSELDVFKSFSMMVHNDIFIGTQSGLSYIAHLLNKNISIFPLNHSFGQKPFYPDTLILNENGLIDSLNYTKRLFDIVKSE